MIEELDVSALARLSLYNMTMKLINSDLNNYAFSEEEAREFDLEPDDPLPKNEEKDLIGQAYFLLN